MHYQILAVPSAEPNKQADELGRLLRHSKQITLQFVTVAGAYKLARARLTLLNVPDRVAPQAERVLALLSGRDDAAKPSAALRQRAEWRYHLLLVPADPAAPPLDGALLDGWHSACLTVTYRTGRALARLSYCPEDRERAAAVRLPGWHVLRPSPLHALAGGRAWQGLPSFAPVPGGALACLKNPPPPPAFAASSLDDSAALAGDETGLLLGLSLSGDPVRLARRAQTLAVRGGQADHQQALLALLRHGVQAGLGVVLALDRALLPEELLAEWEPRVRLLDVQNIADSGAIPWRAIAPELLAQAIGGSHASLLALPERFSGLLGALGASSLRVPGLLGLTASPGDDLRAALAAGGVVVVPQDGDAVSAVVARLLLAYLASPPEHARGLLLLLDPAFVPPEVLRDQAIQAVFGPRSDALLELCRAGVGWQLLGSNGVCLVELHANLSFQPDRITSALADSIAHAIGDPRHDEAAETASWWPSLEPAAGDCITLDERAQRVDISSSAYAPQAEGIASVTVRLSNEQPLGSDLLAVHNLPERTAVLNGQMSDDSLPEILPVAEESQDSGDALDDALGELLAALLAATPHGAAERQIQAAVRQADYAQADGLARAWQGAASDLARPWLWQVVLSEDHAARIAAAWRALELEPAGVYDPVLRRTLALLGADDPIPVAGHPSAEHGALSESALWVAWQSGASPAQLIEQLVAAGEHTPAARARVRAVLARRSQPSLAQAPATPVAPNPAAMNAGPTPIMDDSPPDDALIWRRWLANEPTDTLVQSLSGRRGGPRADAARDHVYAVVIPRVVAQLGAADIVAALAASQPIGHDPRYQQLLQRLARSAQPPMGMLEQSLCKRLVAAYHEGRCGC